MILEIFAPIIPLPTVFMQVFYTHLALTFSLESEV